MDNAHRSMDIDDNLDHVVSFAVINKNFVAVCKGNKKLVRIA
jgi:hypothetical protein